MGVIVEKPVSNFTVFTFPTGFEKGTTLLETVLDVSSLDMRLHMARYKEIGDRCKLNILTKVTNNCLCM
jgi:hypothetical protein